MRLSTDLDFSASSILFKYLLCIWAHFTSTARFCCDPVTSHIGSQPTGRGPEIFRLRGCAVTRRVGPSRSPRAGIGWEGSLGAPQRDGTGRGWPPTDLRGPRRRRRGGVERNSWRVRARMLERKSDVATFGRDAHRGERRLRRMSRDASPCKLFSSGSHRS